MELLSTELAQLNSIYNEYQKCCEMLTYEEVVLDQKLCQKLEKDRVKLYDIATQYEEYNNAINDKAEFQNLLLSCSKDEQASVIKEIDNITDKISLLSINLSNLLKAQNSTSTSIIVLIQHNNDYTSETLQKNILTGYLEFCKNHDLQIIQSENKNTIELKISGNNALEYFKDEIGVHKAQQEKDTSFCIVYVLNCPIEETISFEPQDITIQTCRSSGAGGQHINTTDSAIKVTHLKSGISTICQNERSQFQNRVQALEQLKEKVYAFYNKKHNDYINTQRTKQYKSLNLNNEVKFYNYTTKSITNKNKQTIPFDDFIKGKQL